LLNEVLDGADALAALNPDPERAMNVRDRFAATVGQRSDLVVSDGIADTDVHAAATSASTILRISIILDNEPQALLADRLRIASGKAFFASAGL
jgi:hypothetical protein